MVVVLLASFKDGAALQTKQRRQVKNLRSELANFPAVGGLIPQALIQRLEELAASK